eukprot:m.97373 g.97373  ORF g.97373 m.97373 type:complete len:110 (-) comp13097_c0_seq15:628-957(-)
MALMLFVVFWCFFVLVWVSDYAEELPGLFKRFVPVESAFSTPKCLLGIGRPDIDAFDKAHLQLGGHMTDDDDDARSTSSLTSMGVEPLVACMKRQRFFSDSDMDDECGF